MAMDVTCRVREAAECMRASNPSLPFGITISVDRKTGNILVGNKKLNFCVTERAIEQGLHHTQFTSALNNLISELKAT